MCGRATLTKNEAELEEKFGSTFYTEDIARYNPLPSYNIGPVQPLIFINQQDPHHFQVGIWGWTIQIGSLPKLVINARMEDILNKKSFIPHLASGRCIILMDGYYEWMVNNKEKIPFRITSKEGNILKIAGLWREELTPYGLKEKKVVVITRPAQEDIQFIHTRMPLILTQNEEKIWLSGQIDQNTVESYCNAEKIINLHQYRVSSKVNSIRNNDKTLILPDDKPIYYQDNLFD